MKVTKTRKEQYTVTLCDICEEDKPEIHFGTYEDGFDVHINCLTKLINENKGKGKVKDNV